MTPFHRVCRAVVPGVLILACLVPTAAAAVATGAFDPVAETDRLLASLPAEQTARSDAYFEGGYWLALWNLVIAVAVAWGLLRFGIARRLRDWAERRTRFRYLQGLLFFAPYILLVAAITLPWDIYEGFAREHQYGLSNQNAPAWLIEHAIGLAVGAVGMSLVGALLYLGIRRWPQRWWVAASVATPFLLIFFIMISPVFVAPLFNEYRPLAEGPQRAAILSLARANGVPADEVYQFDASKQTKRISANVSGAFQTIRISLNDNLLARCTPNEVHAVMAHELGHYVLNHLFRHVVYLSLLFAAAFAFAHWFFGFTVRRFGAAWGLRGIDDLAGLPLLTAGLGLFLFLATPVQNTIIRTAEVEADIFGLNAARQPDGFATTALKLAEYRKLAPGPWEEFLLFDHPSGRSRILMAMRWKAEHLAEASPASDRLRPPPADRAWPGRGR